MKYLVLLICLALLMSCNDRELPLDPPIVGGGPPAFTPLLINEFVAKGSINANEYGSNEDWIEIYNTDTADYNIISGKWFITDDPTGDREKYALPDLTIPANGHLVVWCDGLDEVNTQIHTNFKLSSGGEDIALFYKGNRGPIEVDMHSYDALTIDAVSEGRSPDGSSTWQSFNSPTPGNPNP